ncbi:MAG: hypothetical protein KatS3mg080_1115 [Anoxybacillus sp.]|nr:MAG: hypothetical protein KatS3mg080_1115 [Anoxybacillus sp.]
MQFLGKTIFPKIREGAFSSCDGLQKSTTRICNNVMEVEY